MFLFFCYNLSMTPPAPRIKLLLLITLVLGGGYILAALNYSKDGLNNFMGIVSSVAVPVNSTIQIDGVSIPVELAATYGEIQKGLSGRNLLDWGRGMLFNFSKPNYYRFWMRGMKFPIDIIWINDDRVVGVTSNLPATFNSLKPKFYTPPAPADLVLEVNAGFAAQNNIAAGDYVNFLNM